MSQSTPLPLTPVREPVVRQRFGFLGPVVLKIVVVVLVVLVADWRAREKYAKREAERAATSETVARLADEYADETDTEGRFVRQPDGQLPESDVWDRPLRLAYKPGILSDGLEVRSAGPDGEWKTWDDVVAKRSSRISNRALVRDATGGVLDAASDRLTGKKQTDKKK